MKKLLCVVLVLCLLLCSGCSAAFLPRAGLVEITGLYENTNYVSYADKNERYWLLLACVCEPEQASSADSEQEEPTEQSEEKDAYEDRSETEGTFYYTLNYVNPRTAKVVRSVSLEECPLEDIFGAKFNEEGNIVVFDDYNEKCVQYSPKLEQIGKVQPYQPTDVNALARKNALVGDSFSNYESFANDYCEYFDQQRINCYAFYGENDSVYFAEQENFSPCCGDGKKVLGTVFEPKNGYNLQSIRVYDFAARLIVGEVTPPDFGADKTVSLVNYSLKADSAFLALEEGSGEMEGAEAGEYQNHYYLWNYTREAPNAPFEAQKLTAQAIEQKNEQLSGRLHTEYGVQVHINEPNQSTLDKDEVYALKLTASPLKVYMSLVGIQAFFEKLPAHFVQEVFTGMEHMQPKGFHIFLAKEVVGYPSAYANIWTESFEIALATDTFSISTLAHEFMHIIDARLEDDYWEENWDDMWSAYNPKNFSYLGYQEAGSEEWEKVDWEDYCDDFVSSYALSSAAEDRADTFSSLFDYGTNASGIETPYWYKKGTPAAKKAVFLCTAIRAAFPCMQQAPVQAWEKSIVADLKIGN